MQGAAATPAHLCGAAAPVAARGQGARHAVRGALPLLRLAQRLQALGQLLFVAAYGGAARRQLSAQLAHPHARHR